MIRYTEWTRYKPLIEKEVSKFLQKNVNRTREILNSCDTDSGVFAIALKRKLGGIPSNLYYKLKESLKPKEAKIIALKMLSKDERSLLKNRVSRVVAYMAKGIILNLFKRTYDRK